MLTALEKTTKMMNIAKLCREGSTKIMDTLKIQSQIAIAIIIYTYLKSNECGENRYKARHVTVKGKDSNNPGQAHDNYQRYGRL